MAWVPSGDRNKIGALYIFVEIESASPASRSETYWLKTASIAVASSVEDAPRLVAADAPDESVADVDFMWTVQED